MLSPLQNSWLDALLKLPRVWKPTKSRQSQAQSQTLAGGVVTSLSITSNFTHTSRRAACVKQVRDGLFLFRSSQQWMFFNQYDVKTMTEDDKKCISAMLLCLWLSRPSANTCILKHTNEKYVVVFLLKLIIYFWDDNPWNKQLFICQIIGCRKTVLISVTDCWPLERTIASNMLLLLSWEK